jgi:hydroxymethylbilane synthase
MKLRLGTRGSELALWQSRHVREALRQAHPGLEVDLEVISTRGDRVLDRALHQMPGKGLFTKEIEEALLDNRVDLAVHSLKDLPTQLPAGLTLAAILKREDPADAFIGRSGGGLEEIPRNGSVMTGSLRRVAQLKHARPDVQIVPIRGNVPTRLKKFRESDADGLILARAGLVRLGLEDAITRRLLPEEFQPACGQGAMAVEIREGDANVREFLSVLDHAPTRLCVTAERAYLSGMGGGCQAPIGAYARFEGESSMTMNVMAASLDGEKLVRLFDSADVLNPTDAVEFGLRLAQKVCSLGIAEILELIHGQPKLSEENA